MDFGKKIINGFSYDIDEEKQVCYIIGDGEISFNAAVNAMNSVANDPFFKPDFMIIADLRTVNYHPTYDELMGLKGKLIFLGNNFKGKIALIMPDYLNVIGQLISIFAEMGGISMKSFNNEEKAKHWLFLDLIPAVEK